MKEIIFLAAQLFIFSIFTQVCNASPEDDLVNSIRDSYNVNVNRYIEIKRIPRNPDLTTSQIVESTISGQLAKLNETINAIRLGGDDTTARALNEIADRNQRRAEEKLYLIQTAKDSGDQGTLVKEAIESLEENLMISYKRLICFVAMLIEDRPDGEGASRQDPNIDHLVRDYWIIKNQLDTLKEIKK